MSGLNRGVVLGLWAATAAVAYFAGRAATPTEALEAPDDLGAAVRSALAEPSSLERLERTASLMQHLDSDSVPGVAAVYDRMLSGLDECDIRPFVDAWARIDPTGALDHTLAWRYRTRKKFGVDAAIRSWAVRDPFEAQLVAQQISQDHPDLREGVFQNLVVGWVQSGQRGLDSYIAGLSPLAQDSAVGLVVGGLMRKGGAEPTLSWADDMLAVDEYDSNLKKTIFRRSSRAVARWYPARAAEWVTEHAGENYSDQGLRFVAEQWGEQDGAAAMAWLREQPAGEFRDNAVRDGFVRWMRWDMAGAENWIQTETLDTFHDPAINVYARRIDNETPKQALSWCERMSEDSELRYGCLRATATEWYRKDAVAAEDWLQSSPLEEDDRRIVRTPKSRKKRGRGVPGAGPEEE